MAEKAKLCGLGNVTAIESDITSFLPSGNKTIDVCLPAQVLHGLGIKDTMALFAKVCRALKPSGRLAIIEFKKKK